MTNFGVVTTPGFAGYEVLGKHDEKVTDSSNFVHTQRWNAYTEKHNVVYNTNLKAATLIHTGLYPRQMAVGGSDGWTPKYGAWNVCTPWKSKLGTDVYLHAYDSRPNVYSEVQSNFDFPANPFVIINLVREPQYPPAQIPVGWQITFAGGYILQMGGFYPQTDSSGKPILLPNHPMLISPPDSSGYGTILSQYELSLGEAEKLVAQTTQHWEIIHVLGDLYITSSILDRPWIFHDIGDLAAGPISFGGNAGPFAVSIQRPVFTSGSFKSDYINHQFVMPEPSDTTGLLIAYPPAPTGTSITIAKTGTDSGTKRQYLVTLTSTDGAHTPFLVAWQYLYRTQQDEGTDDWYDGSALVSRPGGHESLAADASGRSFRVDMLNEHDEYTAWLAAQDITLTEGNIAARYALGIIPRSGSPVIVPRLTGIVKTRTIQENLQRIDRYPLTIQDIYTRLDCEMFFPPNFITWPIEEAIAYTAELTGWPSKMIFIHCARASHSREPLAGGIGAWWSYRGSDPAAERYLTAAGLEYDRTDDMPVGARVADFHANLCRNYGYVVYTTPDGTLHIRTADDTAVVASYTAATGADNTVTYKDSDVTTDTSRAINLIIVEGKARSGLKLYHWEYLPDTPGEVGYLGYPAVHWIRDEKLTEMAACQRAATEYIRYLTSNKRRIQITAGPVSMWQRFPRELFYLTNSRGDTRLYRILQIENANCLPTMHPTIQAEEVLSALAPWAGTFPPMSARWLQYNVPRLVPPPDWGGGVPDSEQPGGGTTAPRYFTLDISLLDGPDILR